MKKITFIRSAKYWPCDAAQHACVLIEDLETKEAYIVSYFPEGCNKLGTSVTQVIYDPDRIMPTCDRDTAILYCRDDSKTIAELKKLFDTQFTRKKFNLFTRNCTDAAKFVLEYFFPDAHEKEEFNCVKDSLSCLFYTVTLTSKCFTPSCISTPNKTFNRIQQLENQYGVNTGRALPVSEDKADVRRSPAMEWR